MAEFTFSSLSSLKANGARIPPQKMDRPVVGLLPLQWANPAQIRHQDDPRLQLHKLLLFPVVGFLPYSVIPDVPLILNSANEIGVNGKRLSNRNVLISRKENFATFR